MVKLSDLIALEYKLNQIKLEMNSILATSGNQENPAIIQDRIAFLDAQVKHLSNQLELMKTQYTARTSNITDTSQSVSEVTAAASTPTVVVNTFVEQKTTPTPEPTPVVPIHYTAPKPARDLEHTVGKNVMGIVASCLIFIGLILFGIIIYPYLTDNIRLIAMYAVSIAFIVFGYIKSEKQPGNKFYISLLACGTGAIYITLLMTNIYFKKMDEIALYILLFIWSLIACFLSRKRGAIFQIIGELGLLISIIFGIYYCYNEKSQLYSFILLGYFIIASTVYLLMHFRKTLEGNLIHFIMHIIAAFAFAAASTSFDNFFSAPAITIFGWIVAAYIYSHIIISNILMEEKSGSTLCIMNLLYATIVSIVIMQTPLGGTIGRSIINLAFCLIMLALQSRSLKDSKAPKIVNDCGIMLLALIGILALEQGVMTAILTLVAAILGIIFGSALGYLPYQIAGYVFLAYFLNEDTLPALFRIAAAVVILAVLFITTKKYYKTSTKVCHYIAFMLTLTYLGSGIFELIGKLIPDGSKLYVPLKMFIPITLVSAAQLLLIKCNLHKHWVTKEKERDFTIIFAIVHILIMLAALANISAQPILREAMILIALALFLINNKAIMNYSPSLWPGIYVLGKLTLLVIVSVGAYDSPEYLISVACFILSVISIVLGFKFKRKSFRTYGLILSLLSVAKLILIDIHYENTVGRAVSFLVCGILCFVINIIYNRIDKKNELESKMES